MATTFPTALDDFTNPPGTTLLSGGGNAALSHSGQHANLNDAVEAIEAKIGVNGSAVTTTLQYKIADITTQLASKTSSNTSYTWSAAQRSAITVLTSAANVVPNFALSNSFSIVLDLNITLENPSNLTAGQSGVITFEQDSVGARSVAFGNSWKFQGGTVPSLTQTPSAKDVLVYYVDTPSTVVAVLLKDVK